MPIKRKKTKAQRKKINATRNYRLEYDRDQSSKKRKKYRAELGRYRKKKKVSKDRDVIHKKGKIVGTGSRYKNRADGARKATKSRMKKRK